MIVNYYTLRHLARQWNGRLRGWRVGEIFSQHKNELVICFERPHTPETQGLQEFLTVSCEPSLNCVFSRDSFFRAKKNTVDLFEQLIGKSVESVTIHPSDRQITFQLNGRDRMIVQMFGSKANILLVNSQNTILESFLRGKELAGTQLEEQPKPFAEFNSESLRNQLLLFPSLPINAALKKVFPRLGSPVVREILFRANLDEGLSAGDVSRDHAGQIHETVSQVLRELSEAPTPQIYYDADSPIQFSIITLDHLREYEGRSFDSIDEAIRIYLSSTRRHESFIQQKSALQHLIGRLLEKAEHTLKKIEGESQTSERASDYELMGKLLTANLHVLSKGIKEAIVENVFAQPSDVVAIPLDPHLSPAKNAERYFEKAKKARASIEEKRRYKVGLETERSQLSRLVGELDSVESLDEFEKFLEGNSVSLRSLGLAKKTHGKKPAEPEIPFRVFTVAGGFQVWAGKSGENNDLLTLKYAKPHDLWFHTRGSSGSHVVLKVGTGKGEPSKHAVGQAASIAAYYSKMKNAKMVPVAMTEKKYVRKSKGAPAGTVTLERERILFVEPRLPEEKKQ